MAEHFGFNTRAYRESRGRVPGEVVLTYDKRDADHPYLLGRIVSYTTRGQATVLNPVEVR